VWRSATEARRFVEDELRPAGPGEDTLCHAQLLVTELLTNAEGWGVDVRSDDGKIVWCELASTGLARRQRAERRA